MKKVLIALACVCMLTGCAANKVLVSDGDKVIFESDKTKYTKQELYDAMRYNEYTAIITNQIISKVAELEGVDMSEVDKEADERLKQMQDMYGAYYVQLETYYGGKDRLKDNILGTVCSEKLMTKYLESNFESLLENHQAIMMQVAYFDDIEVAKKVIAEIETGSTFDIAAINNGFTSNPSQKVYLDSDTLPLEVKTYINSDEKTGVSDVINTQTSTTDANGQTVTSSRYYVINVIERDANNFKDEYIEKLAGTLEAAEALNFFFEKHDIKFYDQRTYDLVTTQFSGLK